MVSLTDVQADAIRKKIRAGVVLSSFENAIVRNVSSDLQTIVLSQDGVVSPRGFRLSSASGFGIVYHPISDGDVGVDDDAIVLHEDSSAEDGWVAFYGS